MPRFHVYRTYRWIDKDPVIDAMAAVFKEERLTPQQGHEISGVASATFDGWFKGGVRQPKNATITAAASAFGYVRHDRLNADGTVEVNFEKVRDLNWRKEMERQADFLLENGTPKQKKILRAKIKRAGGNLSAVFEKLIEEQNAKLTGRKKAPRQNGRSA